MTEYNILRLRIDEGFRFFFTHSFPTLFSLSSHSRESNQYDMPHTGIRVRQTGGEEVDDVQYLVISRGA